MSLQVWLPLNGNLDNQGLTPVTVTNNGATVGNNGKIGKCYDFNGGYLKITNVTTIPTNSWSLAAWVYPRADSSSGHQYIVGMNTSTSADFLGVLCYYTNKFGVRTGDTTYSAASASALNAWYHIAATYNGTTLKLYVNGVQAGSWNSPAAPVASTTVYICTRGGITGNLNGKLNDIRIYDHALSAQEVKKLAQGLILHYPLNDRMIQPRQNLFSLKNSTVTNDSGWTQVSLTGQYAYMSENYSFSKENNVLTVVASPSSSTTNMRYPFYISYLSSSNTRLLENKIIKFSCYLKAYSDDDIGKQLNLSFMIPAIASSRIAGIANGTTSNNNVTLTKFWKKFSITTQTLTTDDPSKTQDFWIRSVVAANSPGVSLQMKQPMLEYLTDDNDLGSSLWLPGGQNTIENIVYDITGFKNHGTITGNLTATADTPRYKSATYFTDYTRKVRTPFVLTTPNSITMAIWIKSSNTAPRGGYHMPLNIDGAKYEFSIGTNGKFRQGFYINNSRVVDTTNSKNVLDGQWHHLCATFDGTTIKRYVDGVPVSGGDHAASGALSTSIMLYIGDYGGIESHGNAQMYESDLRIYATALSADDVAELYALGSA